MGRRIQAGAYQWWNIYSIPEAVQLAESFGYDLSEVDDEIIKRKYTNQSVTAP